MLIKGSLNSSKPALEAERTEVRLQREAVDYAIATIGSQSTGSTFDAALFARSLVDKLQMCSRAPLLAHLQHLA